MMVKISPVNVFSHAQQEWGKKEGKETGFTYIELGPIATSGQVGVGCLDSSQKNNGVLGFG